MVLSTIRAMGMILATTLMSMEMNGHGNGNEAS